jgi:hypothetical protein
MLAGETPFKASNTPAMLVKHVSERPRPVREKRPEVPAYLAVAIDRALAKRPEDRWADAAEFRDALDAARASSRYRPPPAPPPLPPPPAVQPLPIAASPAFPPPPPGLSRGELKHWYRVQRRQSDMVIRGQIEAVASQSYDERPIEDRVIAFRRSVVGFVVATPMFLAINIATTNFPWFFIPSAFMLLDALRKGGSIWSDGVGPFEAFKKGIRAKLRAQRGLPPPGLPQASLSPPRTPEQMAAELAPAEVLSGPHGEIVRRAAADRSMMRDIVVGLGIVEREMIPDVGPTVDALAQRVGALATTLHRLDADVSGASLGALDTRIASLITEPETAERERRLSLLQRQRASLHDLLDRRRSLANQLESAGLMLQNLKLDLLKLRSSGIGAAIDDVTSATQQARALSRDIGHVIEAADDLKKIR